RVANLVEALAGGTTGGDGGQAPLDIASVLLDVQGGQRLDGGPMSGVEITTADQEIREQPGLVEAPGLERSNELALVDQPVLQRKQAEEQIAVGGGGGHGTGLQASDVGRGSWALDPRTWEPPI